MSSTFWNVVNKVISESDVVIEVLDARSPETTRNTEIENKVKAKKKEIIYVQNKSDLVPLKDKKSLKVGYQVFVSSTNNLGTTNLRKLLHKLKGDKPFITIGIVGYPNTGKSSLINVLKQRKSASTSARAGHTKGIQKIKISKGMYLLDTPGVYAYKEADEVKLAAINCISAENVKEPDLVALEILKEHSRVICDYYKIKKGKDEEETLELLTARLNLYKKGKELDIDRASRTLITDWQRGKIK